MTRYRLRFLLVIVLFFVSQSHLAFAFDNTPPDTTHNLTGTLGSNAWYTSSVEVDLIAADTDGGVASTEYWVDSGAHNSVTYLPGAPTQTQFNVSSDGTHTLSYFSTNLDGVQEEVKTTPTFKIDTSAPANWRDFTATQAGNDHTFTLSITVDDLPSGLDPTSAYFNYSVDGITFGYYTTPTSCSSEFVAQDPIKAPPEAGSGWRQVPTQNPSTPGANTITLTTDAVDFCNSSWNLSEAMQFYIRDMAGKEKYKHQPLLRPIINI